MSDPLELPPLADCMVCDLGLQVERAAHTVDAAIVAAYAVGLGDGNHGSVDRSRFCETHLCTLDLILSRRSRSALGTA